MIIPPLGGLSGLGSLAGAAGPAGQAAAGPAEGLPAGAQSSGVAAVGGEAGGFGAELTNAISSLEQTQNSASAASHALATGTVSDPESAVVTVENAQLAMELASQIRTKATEAVQNIFATQV